MYIHVRFFSSLRNSLSPFFTHKLSWAQFSQVDASVYAISSCVGPHRVPDNIVGQRARGMQSRVQPLWLLWWWGRRYRTRPNSAHLSHLELHSSNLMQLSCTQTIDTCISCRVIILMSLQSAKPFVVYDLKNLLCTRYRCEQ